MSLGRRNMAILKDTMIIEKVDTLKAINGRTFQYSLENSTNLFRMDHRSSKQYRNFHLPKREKFYQARGDKPQYVLDRRKTNNRNNYMVQVLPVMSIIPDTCLTLKNNNRYFPLNFNQHD